MAKTLNQLAADVLDELGEDSTDASLLASAGKWVQRAYDEVGDEMDWRWNYILEEITTVALTRIYDLDTDIRDISSARIKTSGEVLEYRSKDHLFSGGYNMEETGTPKYYYFDTFSIAAGPTATAKIGFFPIPSSVKTIELNCVGRPTTLVAATEIPVPNEFLGLLHEGALAYAHRHEREWESFNTTYSIFQKRIKALKHAYTHPRGAFHTFQQTDIPSRRSVSPVRLPPGRFRN